MRIRLFNTTPPEPSYRNVSPEGEGWYEFKGKKWQKCHGDHGNEARYLTDVDLLKFAVDAIKALEN
jgi:hypothetical protein